MTTTLSPALRPRAALAVLASVILAACAPEDIVPSAPMALDGVSFSVEALPQADDRCDPTQPFPARVRWKATDWPDPKFDLRLRSSQGQLFARHNTAEGEQVTDAYAHEGLWILLVDRNSQALVAAQPVPALSCPSS